MSVSNLDCEFFQYLVSEGFEAGDRLPSLVELSQEIGISVSKLREQLEVARMLGLVEASPRRGITRTEYSFLPPVRLSLLTALELDRKRFKQYSSLRINLETAYWDEAVRKLLPEDQSVLNELMDKAWEKLRGHPVRIPHAEHRQLHLCIFNRLENPFVLGLLEAYWEIYEAVGLNLYADYSYLQQVWNYHQQMVDAICSNDQEKGYQALVEHKDLLYHRTPAVMDDGTH